MIEINMIYASNLYNKRRGSVYHGLGKTTHTLRRCHVCYPWKKFPSFIWAICITKGSCKVCEYLSWVTNMMSWECVGRLTTAMVNWLPPLPVEWYPWFIYKMWISIMCNKQDAVSCHHTYECLVQQRLSWMKRSRFPGVSCQRNVYRYGHLVYGNIS